MERTLKKIVFDWLQFTFFAIAYMALIYLGFIENIKGARNVFYIWQGVNLVCVLLAFAAYTLKDEFKEKTFSRGRYRYQRYINYGLQLIYIVTFLWFDYFYAGITQFIIFFMCFLCHSILDSYEKERLEKLANKPISVFPTEDIFPPDWENL